MNLDQLWKKIQQDDATAFELLYHLLYKGLCQYASQLIKDRQDAEETVQDVFVKLWSLRKELVSQDMSIRNYCYRLTHNQCLDVLRRYNTQRESFVHLLPPEAWVKISESYGFDDYIIEQLEAKDTEKKIRQIIGQLPEKCREIFMMSRFDNMSNDEIALKLNLSENTVKTQIYRALQKIKEVIDEERM
jgi:RNA polymerase sigma-70 factor (ECF subfamily)